jgi:hypothetical protein
MGNQSGSLNSFFGSGAGQGNRGSQGSFFGYAAGYNNAADFNSFYGLESGFSNTTGSGNSFYGYKTGLASDKGHYNSLFGYQAGLSNTGLNSIGNSLFGAYAGMNGSGGANSFFGYRAGFNDASGLYNTLIGTNADVASPNLSYATAIGAEAKVDCSDCMILGAADDNALRVGIGTPSLIGSNARLDVEARNNTTFGILGETFTSGGTGVRGQIVGPGGGIGVAAVAGDAGNVALNTYGTSYFQGDSTPLDSKFGNGVAIGFGSAGYIYAFNYSSGQPQTLLLNHTGGNVGIGTTNPIRTLTVNGRARVGSIPLEPSAASVCFNAAGDLLQCGGSSLRFKTNVKPFRSGLDLVRQLSPISFNWKEDERPDIGLAAEEVAKVDASLTFTNSEGEIAGVKYEKLNLLLINAIQQQQAQIEDQQKVITDQKEQNRKLEERLAAVEKLLSTMQSNTAAQ